MSSARLHRTVKGRILLYIFAVVLIFGYLYFSNSKHNQDTTCQLERDTLNRQLQVLIEYKLRMEKSLAEERGAHLQYLSEAKSHLEEDRERQDALKQHFKLLQSQFDDLSEECNKIKNLNQANTDSLEKFKEKYMQEKVARENLQHQLDEKCNGEDDLRKKISELLKENHLLKLNQKGKPKEVIIQNLGDNVPNSAVLRNPYEENNAKNEIKKVDKSTSKITPKSKSSTKSGVYNNIPIGVVPVISANLAEKRDERSSSRNPVLKSNIEQPYNNANEAKVDFNINKSNEASLAKFNRYEGKIDQSEMDAKNKMNMDAAMAEIQKENYENIAAENNEKKDDGAADIHLDNSLMVLEDKVGVQDVGEMDHAQEDPEPDDFHDAKDSHDMFEQDGAQNAVDEDDDDAEYMAPQKGI